MLKLITTLDSLSKSLLRVALVAIVGFGGWLGYSYHSGRRESAELTQQLDARQHEILALTEAAKVKDREIQRLQVANRLLKVDRRMARINVVSQTGSAKAGDLATKFTFEEVDAENKPLDQPRTFTVRGDVIYLDAWVIKYKDDFVESGDPLHSMSVCLFRRIFGESQEPKDGFVLDPVGTSPAAYRTGRTMTDSEREIWSKFWEYANNPPLAGQAGIRAAHGEAPSIKLMPGRRYRISLRASAGLGDRGRRRNGSATRLGRAVFAEGLRMLCYRRLSVLPILGWLLLAGGLGPNCARAHGKSIRFAKGTAKAAGSPGPRSGRS